MLICRALLAAALSGPAIAAAPPEPAQVIAILQAQDDATLRTGERLIVNGTPFCTELGHSAGLTVQLRSQYGSDYRAAAAAAFQLGDLPTIAAIAPGFAAASAGLRVGDQIEFVDGHRFTAAPPTRAAGDFEPAMAAQDAIDSELADGDARFGVLRGDRSLVIAVKARPACRARFDVRAGKSSNANANGTYVQVSSDLVADTQDDGELAAILAHELAHNILRHPQRLKATGPKPKVKSTEVEADRLSVYLLDAAGYSGASAISFWRRWGPKHDWGILADGSHPGWRRRIALIETEMDRIASLRAAGSPIMPPADLLPPR